MKARASLVAEADQGGATRLTELRSEAPIGLRTTPAAVYLVGTAAGPVGGDHIALDIDIGPGAVVTIRSVAATLALPSFPAMVSVVEINATVAVGGSLRWLPEPVVAVGGSRHRIGASVVVEDGGALVWRDELIIGRHGEEGGSVVSRMSLDVGGTPLVRHELRAGPEFPSWASGAVGAGARAVGSLVVVDPTWADSPPDAATLDGCAVLPLSGPAAQVAALAEASAGLRSSLEWGAARLGLTDF